MPGFLVHVGAQVTVFTCRPGDANGSESPGDGQRAADGINDFALCGCRLYFSAAARCKRSLCDGAMV